VLHNFEGLPKGAYPDGGVIADSSGNLYGTAGTGGAAGAGVIYRLSRTGHQTVLYNFTGGTDGAAPAAGVIRDSSGNLYGTTTQGGAAAYGVVYKLDTTGHETVLHNFTGGPDGGYPQAGVIRDSTGNLYGTTYDGGTEGAGVVYKVDTTGHEIVLYNFTGGADGGYLYAGVIRDSAGNLYGTASRGGAAHGGVVFKLDTTGHETVLYNFTGGADGGSPYAGVIHDSAGNLYGTTFAGGALNLGVVYKLDTTGHETVLYSFTGGAGGGFPYAGVIRDSAGNLYGTTTSAAGSAYWGAVYKVDPTGHETVLCSFTGGAGGGFPYAGVIRDSAGNLYGTTSGGQTAGVVYKSDTAGHETVLYTFPGERDGAFPTAGVIGDSAGNLYGTTQYGGAANSGTVYKLDDTGRETVLYGFTGETDGSGPSAGVIRDPAGNLYGTTVFGGAGAGVVYKVDTVGQETVLYSFTGGADGGQPWAGVVRDSAGNLYGTTDLGGTANKGVVYKLDATGHETVLYSFTGADGANPEAGVIRDPAGNLYGTTGGGGAVGYGTVFKLDSTGRETVLYSFGRWPDAFFPRAGVILDSAGNLYGTTPSGGMNNQGVVYKIDTAGHETLLHTFTGLGDGGQPYAGVIRDSTGNVYGTTIAGGTGGIVGAGVVYKLDTTGQFTVLYNFTGGADGGQPFAGVIRDSAGNLYGTTNGGGTGGRGVVFKIKP